MASKITGAQVEYDPASPLIDVDTAIEDLAEDLQRSGRNRQLVALQQLCAVARSVLRDWVVTEGDGTTRAIKEFSNEAHVIVLEPQESEMTPEPES